MNNLRLPTFDILGFIFLTLKLAGIGSVAAWSWWWVLSPFYFPLLIMFILVGAVFVSAYTVNYFEGKDKK